MNPDRPHALYRFYASDGALLYVGITLDPSGRWPDHRKDKPWWSEVATATLEHHPTRTAALDAERAAIIAEKPRYNVVHNRNTSTGATVTTPQLDRLDPIQPGDWIALGLTDGRCPVGEIVALNDTWISVRLKNMWHGTLTNQIAAIRWADVARVELAYPEDAIEDRSLGTARRVMDDEHLAVFQTGWQQLHGITRDPVWQAYQNHKNREATDS